MGKTIDDLFAEVVKATQLNTTVLVELWRYQQKKESDKTPDLWEPTTVVLNDPATQQIMPHDRNRASMTIVNTGPATVVYSNKYFDAAEAAALNTLAPRDGISQFGILSSGQAVTIGSRGAVYAYNVQQPATSAVLSIVATIYSTPPSTDRNPQTALGHAAMLERGHDIGDTRETLQRPLV